MNKFYLNSAIFVLFKIKMIPDLFFENYRITITFTLIIIKYGTSNNKSIRYFGISCST